MFQELHTLQRARLLCLTIAQHSSFATSNISGQDLEQHVLDLEREEFFVISLFSSSKDN